MTTPLLTLTDRGLHCPDGDFTIDPWRKVDRAIITHGHGDHARNGMGHYWTAAPGVPILRKRLGHYSPVEGVPYGERRSFGAVTVSFHPAGHILGSAQVRVQRGDEIWVVTGDFKREPDPTCAPFETVPCDVLVTEATFAYPIYQWPDPDTVMKEIYAWWQRCAAEDRPAVLYTYALGKAQRILAGLHAFTNETVWLHGAIDGLTRLYRDAGVTMIPTVPVSEMPRSDRGAGRLILAPPSAAGSKWAKRFRGASTGFASGWMQVRGTRRRKGYDEGFVLSDHADWPGLLRTVEDSGAKRVLATHGHTDALLAHLQGQGIEAQALATPYGETEEG